MGGAYRTKENKSMPQPRVYEWCCECGKSVAWGSGLYVDRIPECNSPQERLDMGRPYPLGDFICINCDEREEAEEREESFHELES